MERAVRKITVGGLKVIEGGACVVASFPRGDNYLGSWLCSPLAAKRINLSFLTYVAGSEGEDSHSVFCTATEAGPDSYLLLKARSHLPGQVKLLPHTCLVSLYPHEKRSEIKGNFLRSLAQARVVIRSVASSPSAITGVLSAKAKDKAIRRLFSHFRFPAYHSPEEFYAIQRPPEELLREVVAAYQEKVIRIYYLVHQADLDLWELSFPTSTALDDFGAALMVLGGRGLRIPFLVALPGPENRLLCAFGMARSHAAAVQTLLKSLPPEVPLRRQTPVAAVFLHGPHFGDRYGIADTLVKALDQARVRLVALSCTVSSISVILWQEDLAAAVKVLGETFEAQSASRTEK